VPNIRWLLRLITIVHRWLYRVTGGRIGARGVGGMQMLLLTTTGRKSGQARTTPLLFVPDDERAIVIASNAGDDRDPAWWLNLKEWPEAVVQIGRDRFMARARQAEGAEAKALFEKLVSSHANFANYRKRTTRDIPIVVLERERNAG
jgi:deazaflavin-dependent oxidoreductase (nitroreductase family)